jgi:hypothetical protein
MIGKAIELTGAAGRPELVAGFSESWKGAKDIADTANGTPEERKATRQRVAKRLAKKVIYKNGARAFLGSAHSTRHLTGSFQDTIADAAAAFETAKANGSVQTEVYDPDTDTMKTATLSAAQAERGLKQVVAQAAYLQDINGTLPAEQQGLIGEMLGRSIGSPVTIDNGPAPQAASTPSGVTQGGVILPAGVRSLDTTPQAPSRQTTTVHTVQDLVDGYRGDKETQQFKYDAILRAQSEGRNLSAAERATLAEQAAREGRDPSQGPSLGPTLGPFGS